MGSVRIRGSQSGFTLIELVVVIVILGILAATAIPKFIDLSSEAKKASVSGVYGGFNSAVAMARSRWMVDGAKRNCTTYPPAAFTGCSTTHQITIDGSDVAFNGYGYPTNNASTALGASTGLIETLTAAMCVNTWKAIFGGQGPTIGESSGAFDYVASASGNECTYTYFGGTGTSSGRSFKYDVSSGAMTLTNS